MFYIANEATIVFVTSPRSLAAVARTSGPRTRTVSACCGNDTTLVDAARVTIRGDSTLHCGRYPRCRSRGAGSCAAVIVTTESAWATLRRLRPRGLSGLEMGSPYDDRHEMHVAVACDHASFHHHVQRAPPASVRAERAGPRSDAGNRPGTGADPAPPAAATQDESKGFWEGTELGGLVDVYYDYYSTKPDGDALYRMTSTRSTISST